MVKTWIGATIDALKNLKGDSDSYNESRNLSSGDRAKLEALESSIINAFQSMIDQCDEYDITYHEGGIRKIAMYLRIQYDKTHNKEDIEKDVRRGIKKFISEFKESKKRTVNVDNWSSSTGVTESAWNTYVVELGFWRYSDADN